MDKGYLIAEEVKMKLMRYKIFDKEKIEKVQKIIELKREQWDKSVTTKDGYSIDDLTLLLAYEYCTATEMITGGRINFEEALDKLSQIDKFRLGESKLGDAIVIYGKSVNDLEAVSVVSEEYDNVRRMTGAQYTNYVGEDGNFKSAVFIFGKKLLKDESYTAGMDFCDLTDIRQTVFHEWNHNAEKEKIAINWQGNSNKIPRKYRSLDGKVYTNYEVVNNYRLPIFKKGVFARMSEPYEMEPNKRIGISQGLSTKEETLQGIKMHNQITEGFVELYARQMVLAIDENAKIDESKYYEHTEIAKKITEARDGKNNKGQTAADFLSQSTVIKNELETITIEDKKDGLHYIADYLDDSHQGRTDKKKLMIGFNEIAKKMRLTKKQVMDIQSNPFWTKNRFVKEDVEDIINVFASYIKEVKKESEIYEKMTKVVNMYISAVNKERKFFDDIPVKLGYTKTERNGQNLDDSDDSFEY